MSAIDPQLAQAMHRIQELEEQLSEARQQNNELKRRQPPEPEVTIPHTRKRWDANRNVYVVEMEPFPAKPTGEVPEGWEYVKDEQVYTWKLVKKTTATQPTGTTQTAQKSAFDRAIDALFKKRF